jgi:hypothetical protein
MRCALQYDPGEDFYVMNTQKRTASAQPPRPSDGKVVPTKATEKLVPIAVDPIASTTSAAWYRDFAERAGSPWIWEARLRTAENLETQARRIEPGDDRQIQVSP